MTFFHPLKEKLKRNQPVLGMFNTLNSPLVTEVLAKAELDFIIIDMEHGPFDPACIHFYVDKCERHGAYPIIRIPRLDDSIILQALDQGAKGIMVPHIETCEQAKQLVQAALYPPQGKRGFSPFTKAAGFNHPPFAGNHNANAELLLAAIVESKKGIDNLDEILQVEGLDVIYLGAYDLSQDLGYGGNIKNKDLAALIKQLAERIKQAGKWPSAYVPTTLDEIKSLMDLQIFFITYQVDAAVLLRQVYETVSLVRSHFKI